MGFDPSNDRTERAAINQSVFREVNERLEGLAETFQYVAKTAAFTCECASLECVEQMEMSLDEYEGFGAIRTGSRSCPATFTETLRTS